MRAPDRALADKQNKRIADVKDWLPLLRFTQGNPLTITVMVGQALRDGLETSTQVNAYLEKLHNGETAFDDEASEGRSKSLGASLSYGFEQAFSADERKVLALLHFFQGFVDVDAITQMGKLKKITGEDLSLDEVRGLTRDTGIAIFDKAADIGLLTSHGGGYYTIHPALPWFFKSLFDQYYPEETPQPSDDPNRKSEIENRKSALRAFVESMGVLSNYYHDQYGDGNRDVIAPLRSEEPNLLHARSLGQQHGWWQAIISAMQALNQLYGHTGRRAEWKRLVEEIVPDFVGADDLPLSGREEQWSIVTQHRVRLAQESHNWAEAERLQRLCVEWDRRRASSLLARPAESLSSGEKNTIRSLAASSGLLGQMIREQGKPECVQPITEQYELNLHINDVAGAAIAAFNLGHAYKNLPTLRNLDEAERWYQRAFELENPNDKKGRALDILQLGNVAYQRFNDAKEKKEAEEDLLKHLNAAADYYQQALALLPPDAVDDLAVVHGAMGNLYRETKNLERSVSEYHQSAQFDEQQRNIYRAGQTRFNIALVLFQNRRLSDALLYARAALRNFESYGGAGEG